MAEGWLVFRLSRPDSALLRAFVDFVGLDVYDETWNANTYPWPTGTTDADRTARHAKVWNEWLFGSKWGLAFWAKFAHEHKKPLAIPEWGLV